MPYRLNEFRAKIQFIAPAAFPNMIYRACVNTDTVSNTRYIQEAVAKRLSEDLGIPYDDLLDMLPEPRGKAMVRWHGQVRPSQTVEEVR